MVIEAQAAGRPVVAVDVGGISEAMIDGRTGRLVRGRSPERLAAAVLDVLGDPSWAARAEAESPAFCGKPLRSRADNFRNAGDSRSTRLRQRGRELT